jgi:hypothetical protein
MRSPGLLQDSSHNESMQTMTWVITWHVIEQDPEQPLALRMAAAELGRLFLIYEDFGIFVRGFMTPIVAFEQYAPPTRASKRSVTEEPWFRGEDNSGQAKGRSNEEAL